ncbi:thaumatin [Gongronella butleri]|nr:thaumatin [Gongronella butleri]
MTKLAVISVFALIAGLASARPAARATKQFVVKNQCSYSLTVAQMANGQAQGTTTQVAAGASNTYDVDAAWAGRFFGREWCESYNCTSAGANDPASLAEFTLSGYGGNDYYDVSFVDGYNIPIEISPINPSSSTASSGQYNCGSPKCDPLPTCPDDFKVYDGSGNYVSCQSACSATNNPQYCCTGNYNTPATCPSNQFSQAVKAACPDVYSYAYDDATSTFTCQASGYNIVFCPGS